MSDSDSQAGAGVVTPQLLDYLQDHNTLTLATSSPAGVPHAATMVFVNDQLRLYLWSGPGSTTVRNIERNPAVAVTIDHYADDWSQTTGIQAQGRCARVDDTVELEKVRSAFAEKFGHTDAGAADGLLFFRVDPTNVSFIDNESNGATAGAAGLGFDYRKTVAFSVFTDLPERQANVVAGQLTAMRAGAGEVIVAEGTPADTFFIIVDGEVDVVQDTGGSEVPVARLGAGQFFGEIAILQETPRTATVRACVDSTLLTMGRDDFRRLMAQSLATTENFDQIVRERLQALHAGPGSTSA